jgi:hypothetical protein
MKRTATAAGESEVPESVVLIELERIRKKHGGILRPSDIVAEAETEDNPIHDRFDWNDASAAHTHRLEQARDLIQVCVVMLPGYNRQTRCYVSLARDRQEDSGGYRHVSAVMADSETRDELLAEALDELRRIETKYHDLTELAHVFAAAKAVRVGKAGKK